SATYAQFSGDPSRRLGVTGMYPITFIVLLMMDEISEQDKGKRPGISSDFPEMFVYFGGMKPGRGCGGLTSPCFTANDAISSRSLSDSRSRIRSTSSYVALTLRPRRWAMVGMS